MAEILHRPLLWALIAVVALTALSLQSLAASKPSLEGFEVQQVAVETRPIDLDADKPERTRFGKLEWRGGIQLIADAPFFGGLSGIALNGDGSSLIAVSDAGLWLSGTLTYKDNKLSGLRGVQAGPLLNGDGEPLADGDDRDAEAITWADAGQALYIAYEHHHRIERVSLAGGQLGRPSATRPLPERLRRAHPNRGIEAVAVLTKGPAAGQLIAFGERTLDKTKNHRGWLIGKTAIKPLTLKRLKGFDITDAAVAPNGQLFVLERRFRFTEGVKMRIRRIEADDIQPGAKLVGEVLLEADGRLGIDNMEGMAAHQAAGGRTILTLISDDNYNRFLQRTILLQFAVAEVQSGP